MDILQMVGINISIWSIAKIFIIFAFLIYLVFALVLVKQVRLMGNTLKLKFDKLVMAFATAHLLFAVGVLILALIIL